MVCGDLVAGLHKNHDLARFAGLANAFADNLILCIGVAPAVAASVIIARTCFARRLKGFGLNPKTIVCDLGMALLNLLATMPVVLAVVILTTIAGKLIIGPQFEMPRHNELKQIISYPQWQTMR